jgi:hypothetical protein
MYAGKNGNIFSRVFRRTPYTLARFFSGDVRDPTEEIQLTMVWARSSDRLERIPDKDEAGSSNLPGPTIHSGV